MPTLASASRPYPGECSLMAYVCSSKIHDIMKRLLTFILLIVLSVLTMQGQDKRSEIILTDWEFKKGHSLWSTEGWEKVKVPHDWAIYGPFDRSNDLQEVAVYENGETKATAKTGRTGGLPYEGKGTYRRKLDIAPGTLDGRRHILMFDGAMSEAQIFIKGKKVCFWPYGYNSFWCDITDHINEGSNELTVLLENRPQSSRWYPGAGLYRKVRYITLPRVHIPVWGTQVTTPYVSEERADVTIRAKVEGLEEGTPITVRTAIKDMDGNVIARRTNTARLFKGTVTQHIAIIDPQLWSPENPALYYADTEIYSGASITTDYEGSRPTLTAEEGNILLDRVRTRFGVRSVAIRPDQGFFLNGKMRKFRGVCMHHDLGPLGAAINKAALRRQLTILKDMGCDAIRTSHNMPAEELVELCDEMGFMVMLENFDEWDEAKCKNGYHRFFNEDTGDGTTWAEKDMLNMLYHFRNNASVVMWSIGNEVPSQETEGGLKVAAWLQDICHREDPTRPVTCGMNLLDAVLNNGFAALLDVPGFNYKQDRYDQAYSILPQAVILGSETASTVSSRGVYHFPVELGHTMKHEDHQSSSYDTEFCLWSNIPDEDFAADEDFSWSMGQFVWTGFDYLGEPTPYDNDAWPNHSSVFGIVDLAYIPKDRFYLYRSIWNTEEPTLHVLPHWNWNGREGQTTPVYVYTSYPSAELFINGKSQGIRTKAAPSGELPELGRKAMERFRLMWNDVTYEPGNIKVVAYDSNGKAAMEQIVRTAGKAVSVKLTPDRRVLDADGNDLCFVNVSLVDAEGNPIPDDNRLLNIKVSGAGQFKAVANGDPTCLEMFHKPHMHLFSGQMTVLVQSGNEPGNITVEVSGKGVKKGTLTIRTEEKAPNEYLTKASRTMDSLFERFGVKNTPLLKEHYPYETDRQYSSLRAYSSTLSAAAAIMKTDPEFEKTLKTKITPGLEKYYDAQRQPAAYSTQAVGQNFSDRSYEDNICIGIDFLDLYESTGNRSWLDKAVNIWKFLENGIDNRLDGGMYRCEQKKFDKSAFANAAGAVFAARLYMATDNQDYLDWAKGMYVWVNEKLTDKNDMLCFNSMKTIQETDSRKLSFNSGQMIQAGAILFKLTGRKEYLDNARKTAKACHETFLAPHMDAKGKEIRLPAAEDAWSYAVMLRGFIDLYELDGDPTYVNNARKALEYAWENSKAGNGLFYDDMTGQTADKRYNLMTQAAMAEMYARLGAMMD